MSYLSYKLIVLGLILLDGAWPLFVGGVPIVTGRVSPYENLAGGHMFATVIGLMVVGVGVWWGVYMFFLEGRKRKV